HTSSDRDWSSDVCSSDLNGAGVRSVSTCDVYPAAIGTFREDIAGAYGPYASAIWIAGRAMAETIRREGAAAALLIDAPVVGRVEIGRASCRERGGSSGEG